MPENLETPSPPSFAAKWKAAYVEGPDPRPLPSAFLFSGPLGSDKEASVEAITQTLLGRTDGHPDFFRIEPEKNSIKIEPIRQLISRLTLKPFHQNKIVVWILEADKMTESASNAILKTLEEPSDDVVFFLLTARPERILPTIRSRCQRVNFQLSEKTLKEQLGELFQTWVPDLKSLLNAGSASFSAASTLADGIAKQTDRLPSLFTLLQTYWRDLVVWKSNGQAGDLLLPMAVENIRAKSQNRDLDTLFSDLSLITETERAIEGNVNKTLALERLFARLIGR